MRSTTSSIASPGQTPSAVSGQLDPPRRTPPFQSPHAERGSTPLQVTARGAFSNLGTLDGLPDAFISTFPLPEPVGQLGVFVHGQLLFVDASNQNALSERATLDVIGQASTDGIELPTTVLNALDLTAAGTARLVASAVVAGHPTGVEFASGRGYVTTFLAPARPGARCTSTLPAIDLQAMKVRSVHTIAGTWASPFAAVRGKLFVRSPAGSYSHDVLVFDLIDPDRPSFERSIPSTTPVSTVAVVGDSAHLPTGIYGVASIPLAP